MMYIFSSKSSKVQRNGAKILKGKARLAPTNYAFSLFVYAHQVAVHLFIVYTHQVAVSFASAGFGYMDGLVIDHGLVSRSRPHQ